MLILTRRVGEVLVVDEDIKITVLAVRGNQIRLGVDAPKDVQVHRQEIFDKLTKDKSITKEQEKDQ